MARIAAALDAWAVLALLRNEPAAEQVEGALAEGCVCSWINLGEVLYIETRRLDAAQATNAVERFADNVVAEPPDISLIREAAGLKARGDLSFADCFAIATAERHDVKLLTGDPEILAFERPELTVIELQAARFEQETSDLGLKSDVTDVTEALEQLDSDE